jgi:hypothetical protein
MAPLAPALNNTGNGTNTPDPVMCPLICDHMSMIWAAGDSPGGFLRRQRRERQEKRPTESGDRDRQNQETGTGRTRRQGQEEPGDRDRQIRKHIMVEIGDKDRRQNDKNGQTQRRDRETGCSTYSREGSDRDRRKYCLWQKKAERYKRNMNGR